MHTLLTPVSISCSPGFLSSQYEETLQALWFDVAALSETQISIYAVPAFFADSVWDLEQGVRIIMSLESPSYDAIADAIFAQRACKASIKAWQHLHPQEMQSLITQWLETIPGMFVCQHGRPFMRRLDRGDINGLVGRH
jgi:DNA mismatch repair ATPase MutL